MQNQDIILEKLNSIERLLKKQPDVVFSFEQACEYLDFSKSYLYRLTSTSKIPFYKPHGKRVYFSKKELDEWILRNPVKIEE